MDDDAAAGRGRTRLPPIPPSDRPSRAPRLPRTPPRWLSTRPAPADFVPDTETIHVDTRRHGVSMALPALRTAAGLLVLLVGGTPLVVLLAVGLTAWWARVRLRRSWRSSGVVGVVTVLALLWLRGDPGTWALAAVGLWAWLVEDAVDWWSDRLVVTDKRVYRRYGWATQHAPSMALQSAVFVDVAVSPLDRPFGCGTLRFDSAAQRDAPLARFPLVPDVRSVHHTVLRLRAEAARTSR